MARHDVSGLRDAGAAGLRIGLSEDGGGAMAAALEALSAQRVADRDFCVGTLPRVSRTFALSILSLPEGLSDSLCAAYLLCRIVDSIEDANPIAPDTRASLFDAFDALVRPHFEALTEDVRYAYMLNRELVLLDPLKGGDPSRFNQLTRDAKAAGIVWEDYRRLVDAWDDVSTQRLSAGLDTLRSAVFSAYRVGYWTAIKVSLRRYGRLALQVEEVSEATLGDWKSRFESTSAPSCTGREPRTRTAWRLPVSTLGTYIVTWVDTTRPSGHTGGRCRSSRQRG